MIPRAFRAAINDRDFATALEAASAIRAKQVSSVELTNRMFARIDRYNLKLNAFAYQMRNQALARAREAGAAVSAGKHLGPFQPEWDRWVIKAERTAYQKLLKQAHELSPLSRGETAQRRSIIRLTSTPRIRQGSRPRRLSCLYDLAAPSHYHYNSD
jgi:hypothetical protein